MFIKGKLKEAIVDLTEDTISVTLKLKDYLEYDRDELINLLDNNVTIEVNKPIEDLDIFERAGINLTKESKDQIYNLCQAYQMPVESVIRFIQYLELKDFYERPI
ncbi:MAG: hypothetical protein ACE14V_01355 [bacterium]